MPRTEPSQFTRYFVAGILFRAALVGGAMATSFAGSAVGRLVGGQWASFAGAITGLFAGFVLAAAVKRRWDPLDRVPDPD